MGESYCRDFCKDDRRRGVRCAACPAPTLLPECVPIVHAYLVCSTQWTHSASGRAGLNYTTCRDTTDAHRERLSLPPWPDLLPDLQTIEHAILQCDREHHDRLAAERKAKGNSG